MPTKGKYAFLLKLGTKPTSSIYDSTKKSKGTASARAAAKAQLNAVKSAQGKVIADLPSKSTVLYRSHALMSGVAVVTDVKNYDKLRSIGNVTAVYPIAPKSHSNSYAVPLQGAPQAWVAHGDLGANSTVAIIDTGVDYTHANFNGPGTVAAYDHARAHDTEPVAPGSYDPDKFKGTIGTNGTPIGFYDFAGDSYNADPSDPKTYDPTPKPDPNPLDCNSHGSHVAGTVAGYGENADGSPYQGKYNKKTPFDTMRIGPGMAPLATLYAYKVFGCDGSTNVVGEAIDKAMDPNGDGDTSDHVNVVNMSLGSDFGSPQDGDSVMTDEASAAGVTMVVASGNGGDLYDVGGSPGDAPTSIAVANSQDAYSQVDALHVTAPGNIAADYAAERSIAFDWSKGDLVGDVGRLTEPGNLDGCKPVGDAYKADIAGKIAFVEWTDDDANRACGSAARGANLRAAGAIGFIYADDEENFAAGITGDPVIPGVLVAKSGGDAIRAELLADHTVTIGGTTANGFRQLDESLNDTVNTSSSRGIRDANNVKPDVTAVGTSVFSTGMGTGDQGLNDTGTSMATPMVAGTAALVTSLHDTWTPEQVKADIMNTADADLYSGTDHTGDKYAPNRVGAGRIDVKKALDNEVLAYNSQNPGTVSASFGPLAVTGTAPVTKTKTIKVVNTGLDPSTYAVSYKARTSIPGANYSAAPATVTVGPNETKTVTLTLTIDPTKLTKTIDPTVDRVQGGNPRQYVADASGLVMFNGDGVPNLRVPVYSAPRPASTMTQPSSLTMPSGSVQQAFLPLSGHSVNQGSGDEKVQSTVAGFELQATSPKLPACSGAVTSGCYDFTDELSADLKYVGATSDAPQLNSIGENPLTSGNGLAFFAISTQGRWRTSASSQEFDIYIDGDGDGKADAVLFNSRLPGSDVMVTELINLHTGKVLDLEGVNDSLGNTDTALFDSDTLVMPVRIGAIPGVTSTHSRISYAVLSYSEYQGSPFDQVGDVQDDLTLVSPLTMDVLHPGVAVYGSYNGDTSALLYADSPGSVLAIRRDAAAYAADNAKGALIVHFHNEAGNKAQVVALNMATPTVKLTLTPTTVKNGQAVTVTMTASGSSGTPTGTVTLVRVTGSTTKAIFVRSLINGKATLSYRQGSTGTFVYRADYSGNAMYVAGKSPTVTLKVIA